MSAFGSFGTTQQQQQQQQSQQQQQQPGGLFGFGSTNTTPATGSLFTHQPATTQSQFGATGTNQQVGGAGGGLFGSTTQQPSSGLFGNTNPAPTGGFGNAQTGAQSGGLFGNTPANGQTGSGGNPFNNAATATGASGGATGNSLFGNTGTSGQQASSGNSFGANPSTANIFGNGGAGTSGNTTTTTAPTGGLFGSTTAPAGGNPFGSTAASSTAGTTGGLFGSTTTAPGTTGNLFGSTLPNSSQLFGSTTQAPGASLFGNTQQQQQQQQQQSQPGLLFGSLGQQQKPATGGLFGSSTLGSNTLGASAIGGNSLLGSTNNLFSSKAPSASGLQQQDAQTQFAQLTQRIEAIAHAWNSNSPQCRFQHYFYNLVDPAQVHLYGRPPNAFNDALWEKAVRENPDPTWFVPVVATGFDDLQKRVEAQTQEAAAHQEKIKDLQARIAALTQQHQLSNASRLQRAAALQTQLTHRVLKLVKHLHLLIPALRSSALRPEEEALRTALEEIDEEVRRPGGSGRIRGKLNELWALVGAVTASRERGRGAGGVEWAVVNEEGLAQIAQIMAEEQAGLAHLTKLLQKDLKELAVIQGSSPQDDDQDSLMSSTATLRASTL